MTLTTEELARRHEKVWGSEVATVLGLNPYMQPHELAIKKIDARAGRAVPEEPETRVQRRGKFAEHYIGLHYAHDRGVKLRRRHQQLENPKIPHLGGHLDFEVVGERRVLEGKTLSWRLAHHWGEPGTNEVPEYYLTQPLTYLALKGKGWERADVAAMLSMDDIRIYELEEDAELRDMIIDGTRDFMERVRREDPPAFDPEHRTAIEFLRRHHQGVDESLFLELSENCVHWHKVLQDASARRKDYEQVEKVAKAHLMREMGDALVGLLPDGDGYRRKTTKVKGYEVEPSSYVDFRYVKNPPKPKPEEEPTQ